MVQPAASATGKFTWAHDTGSCTNYQEVQKNGLFMIRETSCGAVRGRASVHVYARGVMLQ